jgi:hypothetical protein
MLIPSLEHATVSTSSSSYSKTTPHLRSPKRRDFIHIRNHLSHGENPSHYSPHRTHGWWRSECPEPQQIVSLGG